jgi:hypothetical protein
LRKGERKIEISLTPDTRDGNGKTPYFYVILEWTDRPCYLEGKTVPGSENGCWFNTGICGWEDSPHRAFGKAMKRLRIKALVEARKELEGWQCLWQGHEEAADQGPGRGQEGTGRGAACR